MNVDFSCPHCNRELSADARHIGRRVRCPDCATLIAVPAPPAAIEESIVDLEAVEPAPAPVEPPKPKKKKSRQPALPPPPPPRNEPAEAARIQTPTPAPPAEPPKPPDSENLPADALAVEAPLIPITRKPPEDLIDMTAMVDIVFFLLIFFLVTSLQALEAVMNLPTPQASEGGVSAGKSIAEIENDPNSVVVRIEDDDSIWVEDAQVFNDAELALRLRTLKSEGDRRSLLVIGDADASHGAAVRVFDAGAAAGMNGISFIVQEKGEGTN